MDIGSTVDLISMECLRQMKFEEKHVQPLDKLLIRFGGNQVIPLGIITHLVRVEEKHKCRAMPIRLTVVDLKFPYNAIMGLPLINNLKAAIVLHRLLLQFDRCEIATTVEK